VSDLNLVKFCVVERGFRVVFLDFIFGWGLGFYGSVMCCEIRGVKGVKSGGKV
jgi:hypothetical protein